MVAICPRGLGKFDAPAEVLNRPRTLFGNCGSVKNRGGHRRVFGASLNAFVNATERMGQFHSLLQRLLISRIVT